MKMVSLETQKICQVFYLKRKLKKKICWGLFESTARCMYMICFACILHIFSIWKCFNKMFLRGFLA